LAEQKEKEEAENAKKNQRWGVKKKKIKTES
jgi:hypothetical protein